MYQPPPSSAAVWANVALLKVNGASETSGAGRDVGGIREKKDMLKQRMVIYQ